MNPSCSVIIPVFNAGERLAPCIESVLAQQETGWELILVDDGSSDGSGTVCDSFAEKDARIRVIHTPNSGPGAARNTGMDAARAPWITFVDADDDIQPDYLSILLGADPAPGSLVVTGIEEFWTYGRPSKITYQYPCRIEADDISRLDEKYKLLYWGYPVAKLFDTALIREKGLRMDTVIRYHEDHIFCLQYLQVCRKIILLPGMPYHYLHDPDALSLSSTKAKQQKKTENGLLEARMLTDEMLTLYRQFPSIPLPAFRRAVTVCGLADYIRALRNAQSPADYRLAAREVYDRKQDFFTYYRPARGTLHKWWDLLRAFRTARKTRS